MPKQRFTLSKKHQYLIDQFYKIPTIQDIDTAGFYHDFSNFRYNTENILLMIIEELTKGTQLESVGSDISDKAREVFDYYVDRKEK